jgi:hypothetical protein
MRRGRWKEKNLLFKKGTGIWMEGCKRKDVFIKDNIAGDVYATCRDI